MRYIFFGVLTGAVSVADQAPEAAGRWYRVAPEADVTGSVNLHEWRALAVVPDVQGFAIVVARDVVMAERIERLTGALDMRHAGDEAALHWLIRTTTAEEVGRSSIPRRAAGWLSGLDVTHDEPGVLSDGQNDAVADSDIFGRSWGWLADDVQAREQAAVRREELIRPDSQPGTMGDIFTIFGDPASISDRRFGGADWTRGGGGAVSGERGSPFDSGYDW